MQGEEVQRALKVFFLEDNADDIDLELYELSRAGFSVTHEVARNRKEFLEKLPSLDADIMLADYSLPDITGLEAIALCQERNINVPVILITGEGNELMAVDSLRRGAVDYIIKRNISGLSARVSRALEIWEGRKARERAEAEEKRLQQLLFETQKMEAIGRLAGGIAHDFNNILTGIMGFAEISLQEIPVTSPAQARLQSILALSQRGADLVKQLLIFSRRMSMEFKEVEINSFVIETVQFLKRIVEETIEIRTDLAQASFFTKIDPRQFTQVLMNLILNARDAMAGKGLITIRTEGCNGETVLSGEGGTAPDGYVCLSVSDTGVGIGDEDIGRIFDPFFTTKGLGRGTGLGLSIVYSVVTAHGGRISVSSRREAGTTFSISVPLLREERGEAFHRTLPEEARSEIRGKETVLIAEDEDVIRELLASFLRSVGYSVITARDGEEALEKYRAGATRIDLVISDMLMPNRSGIELCSALLELNPELRFILMTGYSLVDQDESLIRRMKAVLPKPFTPMAAARLIREVLNERG